MRASNLARVSAALAAAKAQRQPGRGALVEECVERVGRPLVAEDAQERRRVGADDVAVAMVEAGVGGRVDDAVEHHRPDAVGEEVGVGGAQVGAVRRPQVGQPLVADRLPQPVQVPRHVGRREMRQEGGVALAAAAGEVLGGAQPRRLLVRTDGHGGYGREERGPLGEAGEAADGRALADAARVEADDVEPRAQRLRQRGVHERKSSTPEPPGPPGLVMREPMRPAWSVAGTRATAMEIVGPSGSS